MDIIKIGGSKINTPVLFTQLILYILNYSNSNNNSAFFIISAFGKNTKELKKCLELSVDKTINNYQSMDINENKQKKKIQQILNQIYNFHLNLINNHHLFYKTIVNSDYTINNDEKINQLINTQINNFIQTFGYFFDEINDILQNVSYLNYYSNKTLDRIISYGEVLALNTIKYSIEIHQIINSNQLANENNVISLRDINFDNIKIISAFDFVTTNNNYNNATLDEDKTFSKLNSILDNTGYIYDKSNSILNKNNFTFITQGFIAKSENNEITTMGMESSNLTAAIICKFFNSKKLYIITDTKGVYNCDPRVFSEFTTLNLLDYNQSLNLSKLGLKLLYNQMLEICNDNEIEITYSSIYDLNSENITKTTINKNNTLPTNDGTVFIVNFNFYKYFLYFDSQIDFENYLNHQDEKNTFSKINFYHLDNINLSINYYSTDKSNKTNIDSEEVILLTIYKFTQIQSEFFTNNLLKEFIEFIDIDYKNNIAYLIIIKMDNNENETHLFDKIKSYFV